MRLHRGWRDTARRELLRTVLGLVFAVAVAVVAYFGLLAAIHGLTAK